MYYKGYFRNRDTSKDNNGQLYKVVIITNFNKEEYDYGGELVLTSSPFRVSYESEDSNLFKPYKCSSATVSILQSDYRMEFSNANNNNVLVMLLKLKEGYKTDPNTSSDGITQLINDKSYFTCEWIGFATPNTYSQGYEKVLDSFDLECQDAISTLQYFPYKMKEIIVDSEETMTFISFIDILFCCCKFLKTFRNIYITNNLILPTIEDGDIFDFLMIDQRNFFDEDETPKKYLEVLEDICKFLNLTLIAEGDTIYVLDYTAIKENNNLYYHYTIDDGKYIFLDKDNDYVKLNIDDTLTKLEDIYDIKASDISSSGTQISVLNTFNKMTVRNNLYSYENIFDIKDKTKWKFERLMDMPMPYDDYNVISESNGFLISEFYPSYNWYVEHDEWGRIKKRTDEDKDLIIFCNSRLKKDNDIQRQKVYMKYLDMTENKSLFNNFEIECYAYEIEKESPYQPNVGSSQLETKYWEIGQQVATSNFYDFRKKHICANLIAYQCIDVDSFDYHPKKLDLKPAIYINMPADRTFNDRLVDKEGKFTFQPMFKLKSKSIAVGSGEYLFINFKVRFYKENDALPIKYESDDVTYEGGNMSVTLSIKYGGKYLDDLNGRWTDEFRYGNLEYGLLYDRTEQVAIYGQDFEISNSYNFKDKLNVENGIVEDFLYSTTENNAGTGELEVTFYRPFTSLPTKPPIKGVLISDIELKVISKTEENGTNASDDNTDTEYSNILDPEAPEEKSSIELDISTWDNKQPNYSSALFSTTKMVNGNYKERNICRLKHIHNNSTGEVLRAEELIINNNVIQYSTPTLNLNVSLHKRPRPYSIFKYHFFDGKLFVVDSYELDYVNNSYNINLIEKK